MARVAHAMAMESSHVLTDVIEIQEFPALAQAYSVRGVPKTVINDKVQFTGAVAEEEFLKRVLEAVGEQEPEEAEDRISDQITPVS